MNSDAGEETFDGGVRRTSDHRENLYHSEVIIKQEFEVKQESNYNTELVETNEPSCTISTVETPNLMEIEMSMKSDGQVNFEGDFKCVKVEIKCEEENEQPNGVDANGRDDEPHGIPANNSNNDRESGRSNGKVKTKGRNRILTKKRNMATSSKTRNVQAKPKIIHKCSQCEYTTSHKSNLTTHIRIHTGEKLFECEICAKSFTQKQHLNTHKKTHLPQSNIRCSKCRCGFENEREKVVHETKCQRRQFECHLCKYSPVRLSYLKVHMRVHHTGEKPFKCSICYKTFTTKMELAVHSRVHKKQLPCACMKCGRRFVDENGKQSHEKRCNRRRLECYICRYNCFVAYDLKKHMQPKHTGDKQFCCGICQKTFVRKLQMKQHLAVHAKK